MSIAYVKEGVKKALSAWDYAFKDNNVMVAGGMFTSIFTKTDVNDIDCYFRSKRDMLRFILDIAENESYPHFVNITDKSMTLTAPGEVTIQLIYFKFFDNLQDVFKSFDFTISMCGYDWKTDKIEHHEDFFSDLSQRRLSFNSKTAFPLVSALRVNKFKDRGFHISRSQMIKVMLAVAALDIKTPDEFVKHVGGMYGNAALSLLQSEEQFTIDSALDKLAELEGENNSNILIAKNEPKPNLESMPLKAMVRILATPNLLDGGWYRKPVEGSQNAPEALYRAQSGYGGPRNVSIPLNIALLFAKDKERKPNTKKNVEGIYFKHVKLTDEPNVFVSIHDKTFKYKLGQEITDNHGMYLCTASAIRSHHFAPRSEAILACRVDTSDVVGEMNNEFRVKRLTPLFVVPEDVDLNSVYGAMSPVVKNEIPVDVSSQDIFDDIDEEILDELLGYYEMTIPAPAGPVGCCRGDTGQDGQKGCGRTEEDPFTKPVVGVDKGAAFSRNFISVTTHL